MKTILISFTILLLLTNVNANDTKYMKFTNDLLVDKTFYIEEESGYDTIVKFYLNDEKLRMFYIIFYKNKLDETMTLDAKLNSNGNITYTVFGRPTELKLQKITDKEYIIKEFHNHSHQYTNTLRLQLLKPKEFAQ